MIYQLIIYSDSGFTKYITTQLGNDDGKMEVDLISTNDLHNIHT